MTNDTPFESFCNIRRHLTLFRQLQIATPNHIVPQNAEELFSNILSLSRSTPETLQPLTIKNVLSGSYVKEEDFDKALFDAMANDLTNNGAAVERSENMIIVVSSISKCRKYAFGFSRQAKGKNMFKQESEQGKDRTVSDVMDHRSPEKHSEYDHVCCLFKRADPDAEWEVKDCFSVVELKMSDTSSAIQWKNDKEKVNLLTDDPIVQEIDYVLESTWRSICRNGLGSDLRFLPVAMVAAQRSTDPTVSKKNRWVKASMLIPTKAGGSFNVQPNGFGGFAGEQEEQDDSIQHAVGLYLETMLFGLELCEKCSSRKWAPCVPSPMSGSRLFFGEIELQGAKLCGSPLFAREQAEAHDFFPVSQGELYRVDELTIYADTKIGRERWLINVDKDVHRKKLLVKVWSVSVHDCLQNPAHFNSCIQDLLLSKSSVIEELSSVLLGIYQTETGTITLMQEIDGKPVCLANEPWKISEYWSGFEVLVRTVLLPLAGYGIIYQDLRPGYDLTSNILWVDEGGETKIKLIDFESLCDVRDYNNILDDRYPDISQDRNAYAFLHCQIAAIAYAWIEKVRREEFAMSDAVDWVRDKSTIQDSQSEEDIQVPIQDSHSGDDIQVLLKFLKQQVIEASESVKQPTHAPVAADSSMSDDNNSPAPNKRVKLIN